MSKKTIIMEIKKSYELYQVGQNIVLKQMYAPDYETKIICVADKLLTEKNTKGIPEEIDSRPFFVLCKESSFVLCWEKQNSLQIITDCTDFHILANSLLLQKDDCWYWWPASASENQLQAVGNDLQLFRKAFILPDKSNYLLLYFENQENLKCKRCLSYEVLSTNIRKNSFLHEELFPDVLKIITAEEGTLYVSIRRKQGPSFNHMYGITEGKNSYEFEFAKEQLTNLIDFTKFANKTCDTLLDKGFLVATNVVSGNYFDYASMQKIMHQDVKVSIGARLTSKLTSDVSIDVNISRLYRKQNKAYMVSCPNLNYYKEADEIRFEKSSDEHTLWINSDGITDKIYCKGNNMLRLAKRIY